MEKFTLEPFSFSIIQPPEPSEWRVIVAGVTYVPLKGKEPNRFHRFMQGLCFGARWERWK